MKKAKKVVLGILVALGIVVVLPVGLLYGFTYSRKKVNFEKDESFDEKNYFRKRLVHSLDDTKESKKLSLSVGEKDLNQFLYRGVEKKFSKQIEDGTLRNVSVDIKGDGVYVFAIDIEPIGIYATRIELTAKMEETKDAFLFHVVEAKLGRASALSALAMNILTDHVKDEDINSAFREAGLSATCSLKDKTITYKKTDLSNDILSLVPEDNENSALLSSVFENILSWGLTAFDFSKEDEISLDADLTPLHANDSYFEKTRLEGPSDFPLAETKAKVKTLLDHGVIDNLSGHDTTVFTYLISGYEALSDEEKAYIDTLDLRSIGISDNKAYLEYYHPFKEVKVSEEFLLQAAEFLREGISLDEEFVNRDLANSGILGRGYVLSDKDSEEEGYTVNALSLDQAYVNILDDRIYLSLGMNFNGYETSLAVDCHENSLASQNLENGMVLDAEKIYFGSKEISDSLKKEIFQVIQDSLEDEESQWMAFDAEKGEMTLDFNQFINGTKEAIVSDLNKTLPVPLTADKVSFDSKITLSGDTLSSDGYINIKGKYQVSL